MNCDGCKYEQRIIALTEVNKMKVNIEKVANLVGFVDNLILLMGIEKYLNERIIEGLFKQALIISEYRYNEELNRAVCDIALKYRLNVDD